MAVISGSNVAVQKAQTMKLRSKLVQFASLAALSALGGCASASMAPTCGSLSFPIYFPAGESALTPAAARVVQAASPRIKQCRVDAITIVVGADDRQVDLNRRRAEAVEAALVDAGASPHLAQVEQRSSLLPLFRHRVTVSIKLRPH